MNFSGRTFLAGIGLLLAISILTSCEFDPGRYDFHVYLTWRQADTSTTMTVNYHTNQKADVSQVFWDTESRKNASEYRFRTQGTAKELKGADRWVHQVELTGLEPGSTYYFTAGDDFNGYSVERKFKTLPNQTEVKFVSGGDMSIGQEMKDLLKTASQTDPDVAFIGGDVTYCDGDYANTDRWDEWLKAWGANMVTSTGHTIPMIMAIGNHEVNLNFVGANRDQAPFYFNFFDQDPGDLTYFSRNIGKDSVLYVLDTGHISPWSPIQSTWLSKEMAKAKNKKYKMTIYHVPLYPSHRSYYSPQMVLGRLAWAGIFDENELTLSFENHDHIHKRTHYIHNDEVVEEGKGVLYLGDGAWGKGPRELPTDERWYIDVSTAVLHFWEGKIGADQIDLRAIDSQSKAFDEVSVKPRVPASQDEITHTRAAARGSR